MRKLPVVGVLLAVATMLFVGGCGIYDPEGAGARRPSVMETVWGEGGEGGGGHHH